MIWINDFNFTFIEGSSAIFFTRKCPFIRSSVPSLLVWDLSPATAVGLQTILWVPSPPTRLVSPVMVRNRCQCMTFAVAAQIVFVSLMNDQSLSHSPNSSHFSRSLNVYKMVVSGGHACFFRPFWRLNLPAML